MAKRISPKNIGHMFELRFHGTHPSEDRWDFYTLIKFEGEGEDARATFKDEHIEWEAYRFAGHWAYGSSGDRLSVCK